MTEIAVKAENLSKMFRIPHEKHSTLQQVALHLFSRKTYQELEALKDISFEVKKGEFFGIIGRNGSGKSTLLKILAGIYVPGKGRVHIDGKLSPFLELGVGFNPELTARENVFLGGSILGLTRKEIAEKFDRIVMFAELENFMDMKLKNFSSGMQVRLAFSLAINVHADILLMDEVLAVGDTNFQNKCLAEFNNYKDQGKTVVLVSHDIGVIQKYCDRIMLLRKGKVERIGKAIDVVEEYLIQNTMDEEQAKKKAISQDQGGGIKEKIAEIKKVEFLSDKGEVRKVFNSGENIRVRVYFKQNKEVEYINFGVALFNNDDNYCCGINTITDKIDVKPYFKKGYFEIDFLSSPLNTNNYCVKVGIFGKDDSIVYDFLSESPIFKVNTEKNNAGIINLDYNWL